MYSLSICMLLWIAVTIQASPYRKTVTFDETHNKVSRDVSKIIAKIRASRGVDNDRRHVFPQCEEDGQQYDPLDDMPHDDPCASCHCGFVSINSCHM